MAIRKRRRIGKASAAPREIRLVPSSSNTKGYTYPYVELLTKAQDSKQLQNPFADTQHGSSRGEIAPVYDPTTLARLVLENNILKQCIEAYVVNIESHGHVLEYVGPEGSEDSEEAQNEKTRLQAFLAFPSPENTFREVREQARWDKESGAGAYFEIARNQRGEIILFDHVPGCTMRLTKKDEEATQVDVEVPNPEQEGELILKRVSRHFRRFVQKSTGNRRVYFKEFGDPRSINPTTGKEDPSLAVEEQATEILHWFLYSPGLVYGAPRWIGQLPAVLGSRESEIVNLNFFRENAIPAMAILVSGGALTDDTFARISQYINAVRGRDAMNRIMILEAAADEAAGSVEHSQPAPRIEMKPMISERQQEGLFQEYDQANMGKIRSSFRLPPIYVGRAEDYTRASAFASMLVAENQIFAPERALFDDMMNARILSTYHLKFWKFKSIGPSVAEPEATAKMIKSFGDQGALTPNVVIKIANQLLGVDIESVVQPWGDFPFAVVMEMVKSGREIIGFEEFVEEMEEVEPIEDDDTVPANDNPKEPEDIAAAALLEVRKEGNKIRRQLSDIKDDLMDAVEGVQISAQEREDMAA